MSSDRSELLEQKKRKLAELRRLRQKKYSGSNTTSTESIQNILESIPVPEIIENQENYETQATLIETENIKNDPVKLTSSHFKHFELILNKVLYEKSTQVQAEFEETDNMDIGSISDDALSLSPDPEKDLALPNNLKSSAEPIQLNDFVMDAAKKIEMMMSIHATTKHVYIYDQIEFNQTSVISCQFYRNDIVLTTESGVFFRSNSILVDNVTASFCHDIIYIGSEYGSIYLYDPHTNQEINVLNHHKYPIKQISYNNNTLSTLSEDGELLLWNIKLMNEPIATISTKAGALCMVKMHQYIVGSLDGMHSITMQINNRSQIDEAIFQVESVYAISAMNEFALTATIDHVSLWHIPVLLH